MPPGDTSLLFHILDQSIDSGLITFQLPTGSVRVGKRKDASDPELTVRVSDPAFPQRVLTQGNLGLGETYMDGGWRVEQGSLEEFLTLLAKSRIDEKVRLDTGTALKMFWLRLRHRVTGNRSNVQSHYDIEDTFWDSFLGPSRGYSCGYQLTEHDSNEELQRNKYDRICQKLRLKEGETLFDLGCGYGGFLIHAASHYGVKGRGLTNSEVHAEFARKRTRELGLENRVTVECGDFREAQGHYDKVASIGMFEHLFEREQQSFFDTVRRLLKPDGWALLHTIGCVTATNEHDPFIQKYIFPGSTQNPISVIAAHLERNRFAITDIENIARHYAPTARSWLEAFRMNEGKLDPKRYDARFRRMWEYYLALCVAGASASDSALWHVLFTPNYRRPLPMHRV